MRKNFLIVHEEWKDKNIKLSYLQKLNTVSLDSDIYFVTAVRDDGSMFTRIILDNGEEKIPFHLSKENLLTMLKDYE